MRISELTDTDAGDTRKLLRTIGLDFHGPGEMGFFRGGTGLILNADLADEARYYICAKRLLGSKLAQLHLFGQEFDLIAIVEEPSKLVAFATCMDGLTAQGATSVLEKSGLRGDDRTIILTDARPQFAGAFEEACARLGFRLCRVPGWAESSSGAFTNMFGHRIREIIALGRPMENRAEKIRIFNEMVVEWLVSKGLVPSAGPLVRYAQTDKERESMITVFVPKTGGIR